MHPGQVQSLLDAYGADGDWERLFTRGTGYTGTSLYRKVGVEDRFVTVDRWNDEEHWRTFLADWRGAYDALEL